MTRSTRIFGLLISKFELFKTSARSSRPAIFTWLHCGGMWMKIFGCFLIPCDGIIRDTTPLLGSKNIHIDTLLRRTIDNVLMFELKNNLVSMVNTSWYTASKVVARIRKDVVFNRVRTSVQNSTP